MGLWSVAKKALNSKNPADANYMSLSEMLDIILEETQFKKTADAIGTLNQKINYLITQNTAGITLSASDEEQTVFISGEKGYPGNQVYNIGTFTPAVSGSVKVTYTVRRSSSSSSGYANVIVATSSDGSGAVARDTYSGQASANKELTFNVTAGTTYYVRVEYSNGAAAGVTNYYKNLMLKYSIITKTNHIVATTIS